MTLVGLAGCSTPERGPAVPLADTERALPLGIANVRFYADGEIKGLETEALRALEREVAARRATGQPVTPLPPAIYLAVSGGGDDGAFGAGLLAGWSESGTRPEFKLVTGVSTGALIAPFAFLGPSYDASLRECYTSMKAENVFKTRGLIAAIFDDAMADTSPLANVIARYANEAMLEAIAREYAKGRLLLIGTTDLDAQRPVLWNIGAIASSGHPRALELFRKILRASAAVPGAFQPVLFDVELDGRQYQELHVDGGAIAQLFLYPASLNIGTAGPRRVRRAYIIRNARLDPNYAVTERRTINIAGRAVTTMLAASGRNDVLRTYFISKRDGVDYNLAFIGPDFNVPGSGEFNPTYMGALYDYGYQHARGGYRWRKAPPGLETPSAAVKP
jgi:predicted acylesterase/phospholipase RssA